MSKKEANQMQAQDLTHLGQRAMQKLAEVRLWTQGQQGKETCSVQKVGPLPLSTCTSNGFPPDFFGGQLYETYFLAARRDPAGHEGTDC